MACGAREMSHQRPSSTDAPVVTPSFYIPGTASDRGSKALFHLTAYVGEIDAALDEDLGGQALTLAQQPEQDVLAGDRAVLEPQHLPQRELEDLLRPGGERPAHHLAPEQAVPGRRALGLQRA